MRVVNHAQILLRFSYGEYYTREQRFFGPLSLKVAMRIIHQDALYTRYYGICIENLVNIGIE